MTSLILSCSACQAKNRVPIARLRQSPRCGQCHKELRPDAPLEIDGATLQGLIAESPLPVLVDFWAPWCGPCRAVAPVLQKVAQRYAGQALVVKVNTDENPDAGARHNVSGIPTLLGVAGGREVQRLVGAHPQPAIEQLLQRAAAAARPS
jgi:thioredoxin 2